VQYIQWAGAEGHDPFFTDPDVKKLFKNHIDTMVNRRNTISNRLYKDDPTIFAWDLMNEPRCDCFPDFIPVPDSYVSCRPECAKKVQVGLSSCCMACFLGCCVDAVRQKGLGGGGGGVCPPACMACQLGCCTNALLPCSLYSLPFGLLYGGTALGSPGALPFCLRCLCQGPKCARRLC